MFTQMLRLSGLSSYMKDETWQGKWRLVNIPIPWVTSGSWETAVIEVRMNFQHQNSWHFCGRCPFWDGEWVHVTPLKGCNGDSQLGDPNWLRKINHLATEKNSHVNHLENLQKWHINWQKLNVKPPKSPPYSKHTPVYSEHSFSPVSLKKARDLELHNKQRTARWSSLEFQAEVCFFSDGSMDRMVWFSRWATSSYNWGYITPLNRVTTPVAHL